MNTLKSLIFKLALAVPKSRNWYDNLCAENRLFGTPPTKEKLMAVMLMQIYLYSVALLTRNITPWYRKNLWVKIRTVGVRTQLRGKKPLTIRKKFIITLTKLPQSVEVANRCLEHARRHGIHDEMKIWPAVDKFQATDFFRSHQFSWRHTDYNFALGKDPLPEMGCFASHYLLWQHCVELDEPIIVLEHDAIPIAPIPPLKFKHVILLSKLAFKYGSYELDEIKSKVPREIFYPMTLLAAAHCYAITPEGANRLIGAAEKELIVPTDSFINKRHVDILYYHPYLVDFDHKFSTIDQRSPKCLTPEETWKHYKQL